MRRAAANNVAVRRNVVVDNYGNGIIRGELPLAFLLKKMSSIAMAGTQQKHEAMRSIHNLYLSGDNSNPSPVTLRGNIISNDTSGSQIRIGGTYHK